MSWKPFDIIVIRSTPRWLRTMIPTTTIAIPTTQDSHTAPAPA